MSLAEQAQPGAISDPTAFAEYLTFTLRDHDVTPDKIISAWTWSQMRPSRSARRTPTARCRAPSASVPAPGRCSSPRPTSRGTHSLRGHERRRPLLPEHPHGDLFVMVKSSRIDLALEVGKYLILGFAPIADCVEDQRGFKYLDDRDLINFVDGTENPRGTERVAAVLVPSGTYAGEPISSSRPTSTARPSGMP